MAVRGGCEGSRSDQERAPRGPAEEGQEHDCDQRDGGEESGDGSPLRRGHPLRKGRTAEPSWSLAPMAEPPELSCGAGVSDQRASGP
jgi:hypothetical protein